ncbi:hypothetical protein [Priestia megaterium]|uniref:hypothetical protein n=1 Tax=Priestia megaterium TaxID=1404 RepID=UPI001784CF9E|nr:hypothetical protein [Priestia megaterium]MBD8848411.1 hypothetical protein [Priestia megaterium]
MERLKIPADKMCPECNGWGIDWNETFDRKLDQIQDTQGLSLYDAINQAKQSPLYQEDYWACKECDGTGIKKDKSLS